MKLFAQCSNCYVGMVVELNSELEKSYIAHIEFLRELLKQQLVTQLKKISMEAFSLRRRYTCQYCGGTFSSVRYWRFPTWQYYEKINGYLVATGIPRDMFVHLLS